MDLNGFFYPILTRHMSPTQVRLSKVLLPMAEEVTEYDSLELIAASLRKESSFGFNTNLKTSYPRYYTLCSLWI